MYFEILSFIKRCIMVTVFKDSLWKCFCMWIKNKYSKVSWIIYFNIFPYAYIIEIKPLKYLCRIYVFGTPSISFISLQTREVMPSAEISMLLYRLWRKRAARSFPFWTHPLVALCWWDSINRCLGGEGVLCI